MQTASSEQLARIIVMHQTLTPLVLGLAGYALAVTAHGMLWMAPIALLFAIDLVVMEVIAARHHLCTLPWWSWAIAAASTASGLALAHDRTGQTWTTILVALPALGWLAARLRTTTAR